MDKGYVDKGYMSRMARGPMGLLTALSEVIDGIKFGEDLAFCWRANNTGAEIWCEPTARCGHIAHVPIWPGEEPAT